MYQSHLTNKSFRYINLLQPDGLGTQFIYISKLLNYAITNDCKVIVDFRKMAFFSGWGVSCEELELSKVLFFDTDRIIYQPTEIDSILTAHPEEIVGARFCEEKFNPEDVRASFIWANELLSSMQNEYDSCVLKDKWKLVGEYKEMFEKYQPEMSSCMGVHARLGNGEQHVANGGYRMKIPKERFFSAIDACEEDKIFICTDTPSFLEACLNRYGSRIVSLDRYRPPENCGPGHNTWSIYDHEKKAQYIRERNNAGPYRLLGEAMAEMFLLGECRNLVCNNSSFTHYARVCCNVPSVVIV